MDLRKGKKIIFLSLLGIISIENQALLFCDVLPGTTGREAAPAGGPAAGAGAFSGALAAPTSLGLALAGELMSGGK